MARGWGICPSTGSYIWGIWTAFCNWGTGIWPPKTENFKTTGMLELLIDRCIKQLGNFPGATWILISSVSHAFIPNFSFLFGKFIWPKPLKHAKISHMTLLSHNWIQLMYFSWCHHPSENNIPKSSKIHDCTRRTHFVNVYVNTRTKGNPIKAVREAGSIIFRFDWKTYKLKEYRPEVIGRPDVFRDRNHTINR